MNPDARSTVLIVPGLRDHVPQHWQTHLQATLPRARTVAPLEHDKLSCRARVDALHHELAAIDGPVILVAHSAGVMIVVHWALHHQRTIKGALLAAPADLELPLPQGYPRVDELQANGWLPIPRRPACVSEHRGSEQERSARALRSRGGDGNRLERHAAGPGQRRTPQPRLGLRTVGSGRGPDRPARQLIRSRLAAAGGAGLAALQRPGGAIYTAAIASPMSPRRNHPA